MSSHKEKGGQQKKRRRNPLAVMSGILSTILLAALVAVCVPLTVPRLFGCHTYSVISGSMEPAIPTGSLVYIKSMEPEEMQTGDVIAFYGARDQASIITHRVVENRVVMGELITKGDANRTEDMNPVPYENVIGSVAYTIPAAGRLAELLTSQTGKAVAGGLILAAVLLQFAASLLERKRRSSG